MMLPEWLVWWALPPAESYLRRRSPMAPMVPTSGQLPRGSAPYAPLTDRPLTEDELARWQAENPMPEPDEEELERGFCAEQQRQRRRSRRRTRGGRRGRPAGRRRARTGHHVTGV
ncbi:hypothetical protein [Arsenicicoccus sp. UBA7492]|uniref:hypothetical protein n=1 Tax=Arsenicicoccus sp. UBA7492 TaxID=1946057 RepID=UPI00257A90A6|nr:hypothetical protein [Arsenicicoccus sp. UBA7492]